MINILLRNMEAIKGGRKQRVISDCLCRKRFGVQGRMPGYYYKPANSILKLCKCMPLVKVNTFLHKQGLLLLFRK